MSALTDKEGKFSFSNVAEGKYVLHVDADSGTGASKYGSADFLFDFSTKGKLDTLNLAYRDAGGGSCGGISLD